MPQHPLSYKPDQAFQVQVSELTWQMKMVPDTLEIFTLDLMNSQQKFFLTQDPISLQSLVIFASINSWVNKSKMNQYLIQPLSHMYLVEKTWENANQLLIFQKNQKLHINWAKMMSNWTMALLSFRDNCLMIELALIQTNLHVLTLIFWVFTKQKVLMTLTELWAWLSTQKKIGEILITFGLSRTRNWLIKLLSVLAFQDQNHLTHLMQFSEAWMLIK